MIYKFASKIVFILAVAFVFGASSHAVSAQSDAKNINISGEIGNGRLQKGKSAVVSLILDIPGNLHVQSNRPSKRELMPTTVKITAPGLKTGAINYPRGVVKTFGFSTTPLSVYEGRTVVRFNVTVPPNFKGDVAKIRAVVSYQPCEERECYRPRTGEVTLSAAVR